MSNETKKLSQFPDLCSLGPVLLYGKPDGNCDSGNYSVSQSHFYIC